MVLRARFTDDDAAARYNPYTDYGQSRLIQVGRIFWDQTTLERDEHTTMTTVAFVPPDLFGHVPTKVLRLGVDLIWARADRVPVGEGQRADSARHDKAWENLSGHCLDPGGASQVLLARWPIVHSGLVEHLTESDRYITTARYIGDKDSAMGWWPDFPDFDYAIHDRGQRCIPLSPGRDHLAGQGYGRGLERGSKLGQTGAITEAVVPPG